jgi:hypothetical protein
MRTIIIASLLAFTAAATACASDDSLDKAAKQTSDGMGNLLKGMGQEVQKSGVLGTQDDPKAKEDKK